LFALEALLLTLRWYFDIGRFVVHRITAEEATYKLLKVKKVQLGARGVPHIVTHDGRTLRYPDPLIRVNDTVRFDVENNKMLDFIHMDTGVNVMVTGGRNQGRSGTIVGRERHPGGFDICHVQDSLGRPFSTRLSNIFVTGDGGKPWVSMPKGGGIKLSIAEERDQRRRQREAQGA
jgi:small subunit ribosomal protein S4e